MAQLSSGRVDIISRENGTLLSQNSTNASRTVLLTEPSVVRINATRASVASFERQGEDLILHMQDGSVVRYQRFFLDEDGVHSELVFDDGVNPPEHALFPVTSGADTTTAMAVTPTYESLESIDPLLLADNTLLGDNLTTAAGIAGVLGLAGIGVAAGGGGGGGGDDDDNNGGGGDGGGDGDGDGGGDGGNNPTPTEGTIAITQPISSDGYLDADEAQSTLVISGTTTNVTAGSRVTLTFNGVNYNALVGSDGSWSVSIPASALANLANGTQTITVTVTDSAGNVISDSGSLAVLISAPAPSVNLPFDDGTLNGDEAGSDQTLTGNTGATGPGQNVSVTIGDNTYTGVAGNDGSWSITIPSGDLQNLPQGSVPITVTVTDAAGNTGTTTTTVTVNTTPATGTLDRPISGDDLLSGAELDQDLLLSGTGTAGDRVTVNFNGANYTGTVLANGRWAITIPSSALASLEAGDYPLTVSITNAVGTTTVISQTPLAVDPALASPTLTLNPIAGDNILNGPEQDQPLTLSGSGSPDDAISVTLNGVTYTTTVGSDGLWSVTVPASDLAALADGGYVLSATATGATGAVTTEQALLTVDTAAPALAVTTPVAGDGYLNNAEAAQPLAVTGTAEAGSRVTVTLNGVDYTVTVPQNGQWAISIPAADLAALPNGNYTLAVSATDAVGNVTNSSSPLVVVADPTALPVLSVDPFTGDDVLDSAEQGVAQLITGTAANVTAGQTVTVTLNGIDYTGTVQAGGSWSVTVPAADLANLTAGSQTLEVAVSDVAGNSASASDSFTVQPTATGALAIAPIAIDNYLNAQEAGEPLIISGITTGVLANSQVTVRLNGIDYLATVGVDGDWSIIVPVNDLAALSDGPLTVVASVTDANGDIVNNSSTLNVAITPLPDPVLNAPFGDGVLSGSELTQEQTLSGNTGISGTGQNVVVSLNGTDYPATVNPDGSWQVTVPAADLQALPAGSTPVTVTVTDVAGNTNSISTPVTVDTSAPTLTINAPGGDGLVNASELDGPLIASGVTDAGNSVTVTFNNVDYPATVSADGSWSVTLPAGALQDLSDGLYTLSVTATRPDGATTTADEPVTIDSAAPAFTLDTLATDNVLNAIEQGQPLSIGGSGSAGDNVIVTLNGVNYTTRVGSDGEWTVSVPAADLAGLANGASYPVNVLVSDASGNRTSEQTTLRVDTTAPALSLDAPSGDGVLNSIEQQQPLALTGSGEAGSTITITLNGETFTGTVGANGRWLVEIPVATLTALEEGPNAISVVASNATGNVARAESSLSLDTAAATQPAIAITLDTFAGNGVLDSAEQQVAQVLTGTTTNVEAGQTVTVTLNNASYTGVVDSDGNWRVTLPPEALAALADGSQTVSVTVNDLAGNSGSASGNFTVNTAVSGIALAPLAGDGYLNAAEAAQDLVINGTSANVPAGGTVQVSLNGETFTGTVNADGSWSVTVPAGTLSGLSDGPLTVTASVTDSTGATIVSDSVLNVAANAQPAIDIDTPFGDGLLGAADLAQDGVLTGNTGVSGAGQTVTVTLGDSVFTSPVNADGSWSVTLPAAALETLDEGVNTLPVTVSDAAGNSASGNLTLTLDTSAPPLTLTPVSGGTLNAGEVTQPLNLSGSGEAGNTVTVTLNGTDYTATVGEDGNWALAIPAADLGALADGSYTLSVTGVDAAGNATTVTTPLAVKADAANLPALTIDAFVGNNVLDGAEQQQAQLLSGSAANVEPGQSVTITLNGQSYSAEVQPSGSWSVSVPAADLAALANGTATISATVSDAAGNTASQTLDVTVNSALSGIAVAPLSDDGYLNASEAAEDLVVSGSSLNLALGTPVTITFNNLTYTATVGAGGAWSVTIPATALAGLPDGPQSLLVSATDQAGNAVSNSSTLNVQINNLPDPTLQTPFGDGVLNAAESGAAQQLQGNTGLTGDGQSVTVNLNGVDYSGTVDSNGNWRVTLPADALDALPAGDNPLLVTVSDAAGNSTTLDSSVTVDTAAPTLTLDAVAGDNQINALEAAAPIAISGTSTAGAGQTVTIALNGQTWTTEVGSDGDWSFELPAGALAGINSGDYPLSVTVSDAAGNPVTSTVTLSVQNQTLTPTINPPLGDSYLNSVDAESAQTLSGTSGITGAGQSVVVSLDGVDYPATVDNSGNWTLTLDAQTLQDLPSGTLPIVVTATDSAGNVGTVENAITVDYSAPELTLNALASDNVLNAAETLQDLVISGTTGLSEVGQTVEVNFNGQTLQAVVLNGGRWRVTVPASDLQGLPDGETPVSVTLTDAAGNVTTIDRPLTVVASPASQPTLTLDTIAADGYLSQAEAGQPLVLTGSSSALQSGQTVVVTLNGEDYTGSVDDNGDWSITVPQAAVAQLEDGVQNFVVRASDSAGNPATAQGSVTVVASADSQPTVTVNPLTGDDIVNAQETAQGMTLTGSSQRLPAGSSLTITLNGADYNATVGADGSWSVDIPAAAVQALPQGENTLTVSGADVAGNPAQDSHVFTVDSAAPTLTDIDAGVGAEGILNAQEALAGLTVTGTSTPGEQVTVTLNDRIYSGVVEQDGSFSIPIPAGDLQQLSDGPATLTVSVTDANGNVSSDTVDITVAVNNLPELTLDAPFGDGIISAAEAAAEQTLSGTSTNLAAGATVTVAIGTLSLTTEVDADGNWQLTLPAGALNALADGTTPIIVSASDAAGNPAGAQGSVDLLIATQPEAAVNQPFVDGALNATEAGVAQVLSGTTGITGEGQTVSVVISGLNGGAPLTAETSANGNWSLTLTPEQLASLSDGAHTVTVTVSDRAGNSDTTTADFTSIVDALPEPTLDTPFGDGLLNATEAAAGATLSGNTGISGDQTVTVTINGSAYPVTVDGDGGWTVDLTPEQLQALPDGTLPVTVTVTDAAGNTASESDTLQVIVNTLPTATLDLPFGNGALSAAEADVTQTLSGQTGITSAGQTVNVAISGLNNGEPLAATVDNAGNWTLDLTPEQLDTLGNTTHTITVTVSDAAGNTSTSEPLEIISAVTPPTPTINTPFGDGVLNITEAGGALTVSGNTGATGDNQGVQLSIDVGGTLFTTQPDANGDWTINLPAGALSGLGDGTHDIIITVVDSAGNVAQQTETFTSALTPPTPTVNTLFGDGLLNGAEATAGATLSGDAGGAASVTVTVGDESYPATVNADGSWTLDLSAAALGALAQGGNSLVVTATDANGNSASVTESFTVNTNAPTVVINDFTGDNAIDYAESIVTQTLSGTAAGAEIGSLVTVTLGDRQLSGVVDGDGNWSVNITPETLAQVNAPSATIGVTVTDPAGNSGSASATVSFDLTPPPGPLLTLGSVAGDNVVNAGDGTPTFIGSFTNFTPGTVITLTIDGTTVGTTTVTDANGTWTIVPDAAAFPATDGSYPVTVTASDPAGSVTTGSTLVIDRTAPTLAINEVTGDGFLNGTELANSQTISGTASTSEAGRTVTVTLNGRTYNAVVQSDGSWSSSVPAADLQALNSGANAITASLNDAAGNTTTVESSVTVDTSAPLLQVDALLGNNILNATDILTTQVLTGRASGAEGQTVGIYLGDGNPIATAVVAADGTFSIDLSPEVLGSLTEGPLVLGVRVGDEAGNRTDATLTVNKVVNQALNLVVDSLFGDGFLNAADTAVGQTISGVAESAGIGATVALTLGGTTLSAAVGQDGKWAIVVPPSVLELLQDGDIDLALTLTDAAGNQRTVSETVTAIVDNVPVIGDLGNLFGSDNLLNIADLAQNQTIGGVIDAAAGSTVIVTLGSRSYQTQVSAGGNWGLTIPAADLGNLLDGTATLGVQVIDPAGNTASQSVDIGIFGSAPVISLNPLFGNGFLDAADLLVNQTISGVVQNVAPGATVTLNLGNTTLTATVGQNGVFSASVSPDILGTLTEGNFTVGAQVTDAAGNTAQTSSGLVVDITAPTINLNPLFGDGLLNAADALLTQTLTGTVGNVEPGARVSVAIGGQTLATTTGANGSFSVALTPTLLQGLADGNLTATVTVTDSAGNSNSASVGALVGIHNLPVITLDPLFGNGILNIAESLVTQTITGTVANAAAGSQVRVNIGNTVVSATVGSDGRFSAAVAPDILGTLLNGNLTVGVSVTDPVGNVSSVSTGVQVGISNPPTVTLNTVFGDGVLSAADLNSTQTISGSSSNLGSGSSVTVTLSGRTYTTTVGSGGTWSLNVPRTDLTALSDGTQTVSVRATDAYGNVASANGSVSVIAKTPPTLSISSLFGDGLLNATDALTTQTISGTSTNAEGSTVTVTLAGSRYTGTVGANGAWSVSVPSASLLAIADGTQAVNVSVTNTAGVNGSASGTVQVGTHTLPTVTLNSYFGGDGYLNLAEASAVGTLSGTATNAVGRTVTVNVAGTAYTTTVASNGTWSVNVPSNTLRNISDGGHSVNVSVSDAVGNTASTSSSFNAITHNLPAIGVDPVLSLVSVLLTGLTITGGTLNLRQGTTVSVTLNGNTVQATTDALGRYSAKFSGGLLTAINLNSVVTVRAVDAAGNPASTTTTLLLGSLLPVASTTEVAAMTLLAVTADDALAAADQSQDDSVATVSPASASVSEQTTATQANVVAVDSGLTIEADTAATTTAVDSSSTAAGAVADDADTFTIGGVTIVLADGTQQQGTEVTGSSGSDTVTVQDVNFTHIDGGAGTDTLVLNGEHIQLDLTTLGLKVEHIEVLNLGQSGTNSVKLDLEEALNITDKPQDDLLIKGADGSQVTLANTSDGVWSSVAERVIDGQQYDVWHNSALAAGDTLGDVLIQHNLQVHIV